MPGRTRSVSVAAIHAPGRHEPERARTLDESPSLAQTKPASGWRDQGPAADRLRRRRDGRTLRETRSARLDLGGASSNGAASHHAGPKPWPRGRSAPSEAGWSSSWLASRNGRRRSFEPGGPDGGDSRCRCGRHRRSRPRAAAGRRIRPVIGHRSTARRKEVRVRSESESRTVVLVLDAVEAWLAEAGVGSAKLSLGDRSYTMVGPRPDHEQPVMVDRERGIRRRLLVAPAISSSVEGAPEVGRRLPSSRAAAPRPVGERQADAARRIRSSRTCSVDPGCPSLRRYSVAALARGSQPSHGGGAALPRRVRPQDLRVAMALRGRRAPADACPRGRDRRRLDRWARPPRPVR